MTQKTPLILQQPLLPEWSQIPVEQLTEGIIILLNKPYGWTSADAVRKIKFMVQKHWGIKNIKVGHAGTLDPLATGVLLICLGKATKMAERLQAEQKTYVANICVGATTPSYDLEKEIDQHFPFEHISEEQTQAALKEFLGPQEQMPPQFSAKMVGGTRAYLWARAGEQAPLQPAQIHIYELSLLSFELPYIHIKVACSKGTYIRALARDLGLALDSGAYLSDLERVQSGGFHVDHALTLEDLGKTFPIPLKKD